MNLMRGDGVGNFVKYKQTSNNTHFKAMNNENQMETYKSPVLKAIELVSTSSICQASNTDMEGQDDLENG